MPINWPTAQDTTATFKNDWVDGFDAGDDTPGSTLVGPLSQWLRDMSNFALAVEAELGVNPSGSFVDVLTRLNGTLTARKTADQTFTTQTNAAVTDLSFAIAANTDYTFRFVLPYTAGAVRGIGLACTISGTNTRINYGVTIYGHASADGTAAAYTGVGTSSGDTVANNPTVGATQAVAVMEGVVQQGAAAGTLQLQARQGAGGTAANAGILKGSHGVLYVN